METGPLADVEKVRTSSCPGVRPRVAGFPLKYKGSSGAALYPRPRLTAVLIILIVLLQYSRTCRCVFTDLFIGVQCLGGRQSKAHFKPQLLLSEPAKFHNKESVLSAFLPPPTTVNLRIFTLFRAETKITEITDSEVRKSEKYRKIKQN